MAFMDRLGKALQFGASLGKAALLHLGHQVYACVWLGMVQVWEYNGLLHDGSLWDPTYAAASAGDELLAIKPKSIF